MEDNKIWDADGNEIKGVADAISFDSEVERSGYVGVETFSEKMNIHEICYRLSGVRAEYERLTEALDRVLKSWEECCRLCERIQRRKRRKTTYRTIRRDCAKRNRRK